MRKLRALIVTAIPWALACKGAPAETEPLPATTAIAASAAPASAASGGVTPASVVMSSASPTTEAPLTLPTQLAGKAEIVPEGDPDEARADVASAIKEAGQGGISRGIAVRLLTDIPIWRLWSGPDKKDSLGRAERIGRWWVYEAPHGTQVAYRLTYEICAAWNDLTWVVRCTLKKGAVVAVGLGNSVSAKTCGDPSGKESYPANTQDWQVWISDVRDRTQEVDCPAETKDYEVDLADIARPKKGCPKGR